MFDGGWSDACASLSGSVSGFDEWSDAEAEQRPVSSSAASCSESGAWSAALRDGEAAEFEEDANAPLELCPSPKRCRRGRPKKRFVDAQSRQLKCPSCSSASGQPADREHVVLPEARPQAKWL